MLTNLLLKVFVPGADKVLTPEKRVRCGIMSGIAGIVCNAVLAVVKICLAVYAGSIAIAADAVNNLSDAGTGIITAIGFRISGAPPDAEHPFGHGRTEYVAGLVVAVLVMVLGISFLKDSISSLFQPQKIKGGTVTIVIFASTVLVKCWLFFFYRKIAKLLSSDVIRAAAYDSLSDCIGTLLVIAALIASRFTSFPLDAAAGIILALMILWAGGSILKDTVNKLLGELPEPELVEKIRETILASPGIDGVHDIIIHNYGENSYYVTAHAEISCEGDRFSAHDILENAEILVEKSLPVHLLLHGDPYSKSDPEVIYWRSRMENTVAKYDPQFKLYDFRVGKDEKGKVCTLSYHLLIPHKYSVSKDLIHADLQKKMQEYSKDLSLEIHFLNSYI
ncbi:MAG: cation transporter [Lentisphaeria bacterium]|nr:cation transporter [Lentisphaeria bacterium]